MLWLKQYVVLTQPYGVIIADVVYPAVLLAYGWSLGLLPVMIGCLQIGLRVLCRSFCNVVVEEDREGNVTIGPDGEPRMKTPNSRIELSYTYLMAWYVMHYPSLMSAVQSSEDSISFVQRLECSTWNGWYKLIIWQILQSSMNYQLVRCFPDFLGALLGSNFLTDPMLMGSPSSHPGFSGGWLTFALDIWSSDMRKFAQLNHICPADLLANLGTTNCM